MSFSNVWRDYNTQRHRRYRDIPKLIALSRGYLKEEQPAIYSLIEATERAEFISRAAGIAFKNISPASDFISFGRT